jgi:uncharacterized delta-60 repeat protein
VVAGSADTGGIYNQFALARYLPDGTLDRGFGGDGKVLTDLSFASNESVSLLAVDGLDGVVVGGLAHLAPGIGSEFVLARYDVTGELDRNFGVAGMALTGFRTGVGDYVDALTLDAAGRIVIGGRSGPGRRFAVARFEPDGSPDPTFGVHGKVSTGLPGLPPDAGVRALAVDSLGRIVAAGFVVRTVAMTLPDGDRVDRSQFAVLRYLPNGELDASLGGDGIVRTSFGSSDPTFPFASARVHALVIDRADRLVVGGYSTTSG